MALCCLIDEAIEVWARFSGGDDIAHKRSFIQRATVRHCVLAIPHEGRCRHLL
jgi:hypothetical protein